MTAAFLLSASVLSVLLVAVLAREIRRRRAPQVLASRIPYVIRWSPPMKKCWLHRVLWMALVLATMGCSDGPGQRLVDVAMESAARQAEQNQQMAELQQQVAGGAKRLVEADSRARQELAELQRELRSDQAEIGRQRDALESEHHQRPRSTSCWPLHPATGSRSGCRSTDRGGRFHVLLGQRRRTF